MKNIDLINNGRLQRCICTADASTWLLKQSYIITRSLHMWFSRTTENLAKSLRIVRKKRLTRLIIHKKSSTPNRNVTSFRNQKKMLLRCNPTYFRLRIYYILVKIHAREGTISPSNRSLSATSDI